ncbi:MAG: ABC transporter ATP-binding protein [Thermodesulfovibrionales bacterium]|nr:ABC transporter ATP-binding protein [Thermodesulfovibrionales bacterium]
MLLIKGIYKSFGGLTALKDVSFSVPKGNINALIGPNGAGKTTLMNIISGIYPPDRGEIIFLDKTISGLTPSKIAKIGISRTFQHVELFTNMTVLENVMVARYTKTKAGFLASGLKLPLAKKEERESQLKGLEILDYIGLSDRKDELASNLPIGEQRLLEIARALATEPKLLLLDEPAAGLNIRETKMLGETILRIRKEKGITILLVDHDMELVMKISDWITVLNFGEVISNGIASEVQNDPAVINAYLGVEDEADKGISIGS